MLGLFDAKNRKLFRFILALACSIAALWVLWNDRVNISANLLSLPDLAAYHPLPSLLFLTLSVINLSLEAFRWKILLSAAIPSIAYRQALASVLAGYATGFFSPNRLGEIIGRLCFFKKEHMAAMLALQASGGFAQLAVSLLAGSICNILLTFLYPTKLPYLLDLLLPYCLIAGILFTLAFRYPEQILKALHQFIPLRFKPLLSLFKNRTNRFVWLLSLIRFMVYSFQLMMLLHLFWPEFTYSGLFLFAGFYFLVVSVVPSFAITEAGIKGAVGIGLFMLVFNRVGSPFSVCALTLWIVNVCIPALTGIYFILKSGEDAL